MKTSHFSIFQFLFLLALLFTSCADEGDIQSSTDVAEVPNEVKASFEQLGFNVNGITAENVADPLTGKSEFVYILEDDLMISEQKLIEMQNASLAATVEQHRSPNLVTNLPRTIKVSGYRLNNIQQQALQEAVDRYNALTLDLSFELILTTDPKVAASADIYILEVSRRTNIISGFPEDGNPHKTIRIGDRNRDMRDPLKARQLLMHHLGHTIGLFHGDAGICGNRTPDVNNRYITGIIIGGTPFDDSNSIMLSCTQDSYNGEFSEGDITALQILY